MGLFPESQQSGLAFCWERFCRGAACMGCTCEFVHCHQSTASLADRRSQRNGSSSKGADKPVPPASLAKLMTAEVVFEALEKGRTTLETAYPVSEYAWRTGGAPSGTSTMFARIKSTPTVADLLQGMIVQSANDGAIVLAEGLAGSEQTFAGAMNQRAKELGLSSSKFVNSTGLPAAGQVVTLEDLLNLARHIHAAHPEYYRYYEQPAYTWNNITQRNRNRCCGSKLARTAWEPDLPRLPAMPWLARLNRTAGGFFWR